MNDNDDDTQYDRKLEMYFKTTIYFLNQNNDIEFNLQRNNYLNRLIEKSVDSHWYML